MLYSVAYVSRPTSEFTPARLMDLWQVALERNERFEVTGVLYFGGDFFFQVLEGTPSDVEQIFSLVRNDKRHTDLKILAENDLASPLFGYWAMKLIDGTQADHLNKKIDCRRLIDGAPAEANQAAFVLGRI